MLGYAEDPLINLISQTCDSFYPIVVLTEAYCDNDELNRSTFIKTSEELYLHGYVKNQRSKLNLKK